MSVVQFSAVILLSLMAMSLLVLLPSFVGRDKVMNRSRWLMASALVLLVVQFLLQYFLKLRQMGVSQAVALNLVFFIPCSALLAHRDWSNETVADHCGFSRSHFQKTFKKETGLSPSEFLEANRTTTQDN